MVTWVQQSQKILSGSFKIWWIEHPLSTNIKFSGLKKKSSLFTEMNYRFFEKDNFLLISLLKLVLGEVTEKAENTHLSLA